MKRGRVAMTRASPAFFVLLALLAIFAAPARAQISSTIVSFASTNAYSYLVAGDTNAGGREAIQTSTVMYYTNVSHVLATNIYQLVYQLVDDFGNPVPILDENGKSNVSYAVEETVILPFIFFDGYPVTNNAPLQPLVPLNPYQTYTPQVFEYAAVWATNPTFTYTGQSATAPAVDIFFDFTNTASPDPSPNILAYVAEAYLGRTWSISNSPGQSGFPVEVGVQLGRYDDFTLPPYLTNTTVALNFQLINTSNGLPVPLVSTQAVYNVSLESHDNSSPPQPEFQYLATNFLLMPAVQLDSVDYTYQIVVNVSHTEGPTVVADYRHEFAAERLFDFNGQFLFGSFLTEFTNLDIAPAVLGTVTGAELNLLLDVSANAGIFPGAPGNAFGNGTDIAVNFLTNGTVEIAPGAVVMLNQTAAGNNQTVQNISYATSPLQLSSSGANQSLTLNLPLGFSLAPVGTGIGSHLTFSAIEFQNVPLNADLGFATNVLTIPGPFVLAHESLPFMFNASSLQWMVNNGTITFPLTGGDFARQTEDDLLLTNQSALSDPTMANRVSNDGYFRNAAAMSNLVVAADANGVAQISCQLSLNPPELRPHFPYSGSQPGQQIPTAPNGIFVVQNGSVSAASSLPVTAAAPVIYARDTADTNCSPTLAGPATLAFTPSNNAFGFTADGGLLAKGLVPPTSLTWGYVGNNNYAQEVLDIHPCTYEMAGTFLSGGQSSQDPTELAAVLLLSGFGESSSPDYVERPGENTYDIGLANYPGLNFDEPTNGSSFLAGETTVTYALAQDAKYYARYGGVSGVQDAINFPSTLTLYGYSFTFSSYRLSFTNSEVDKSLTDGAISFPTLPSGFTQSFQNMRFSGLGYLESASVPSSSPNDHLNYWNVDITPESIEFQPSTNDNCGSGNRFLVLGVETKLPFIAEKLQASLGFQPTGNLVTAADGVKDCTSRFPVPAQLTLQGPENSTFVFCSASEGYFNNYDTPGANQLPIGFYNLAGKLRLPFFEDSRVHLHIAPTGANSAQISVMGGWPDPATTAPQNGWTSNGSDYFNTAVFDAAAEGFPQDQGKSISDYEQSPTTNYYPVAQRDWIQVAVFYYSMKWNPVSRNFAGLQPATTILPVINVMSNLKEVSPGKVDLDFAQDVSLQLPVVKVLDLVNDAVGAVDGPLLSISNAVQSALNQTFDTTGLNEIQGILREDSTTLFQPILNSAFAPAVNQLVANLSSFPQNNKQAFLSNAVYQVQNNSALMSALSAVNGAAGLTNTIVGHVDQTLTDAQKDLNQFIQILAKDSSGNRDVVSKIVQQVITDQGPALGFAGALGSSLGSQADGVVSGLDPTLGEIQNEFQTLSNQFSEVHKSLTSSTGDFSKAMSETTSDTASAQQFVQFAAINISNLLASKLSSSGDYFTADPAGAQQAIQQQLMNAFITSPLSSDYQTTIRQFLLDNNAVLDELMNTSFDQINGGIRDVVTDLITNETDSVFQGLKNMTNGSGSPSLLSAKIRGAPTFNGDSLREIHLNASVEMDVPNKMDFNAFMDIKELTSQNTPVGCIPPGPPAAEITLGAKNVKLDWPALNLSGTPLTLTIEAKWTLQDGNIIGVGGLFDIKGEIGFQGCSVNEIGASLAFGEEENYFAAKVAGTINILGVPVGVQAGVFVGKACSLQPILFIDPLASDVLGANTVQIFEGIYVEVGATLSLSEIIFGTSSCVLDVGVTETAAVFYDGVLPTLTLGMRQTTALDVSLLCLISASASLTMYDEATTTLPDQFSLTLGGVAQVCGSIGPCPFCISGCKSLGISGTVGTGGVSYHISD